MVASEPQPGKIEAAVGEVVFGFGARDVLPDVRTGGGDECFQRGLFLSPGAQDLRRESAPALEISAVFGEVRRWFVRVTEMREEKTRRLASRDGIQGNLPEFEIDIWRRRERNDVRLA